ncbi:MAG: putative Zn-dependent peptidase [Bacteroidetes bacterium]|jgi:predicted Zn-dependent peptidase|nr:putative Zn-dependent peptidase [Bacteroidota bacterium]
MQVVDRKIIPAFKAIEKVELIHATEKRLRNNIPVYAVNAGTQEIIKIEFLFSAGMYHQSMTLQAASVNSMLEEGTSKMTAAQIADAVDFYGAFLELGVEQDSASVILYTLNKHLKATLPVVEQVIKDAVFPQEELNTHLKNKKQKFLVNNQKVATVARKRFSELVFGEQHPYGRDVKDADFERIKREDLIQFYQTHYRSNNCRIILAGKVDDDVYTQLDNLFGGNDWSGLNQFSQKTIEINSTQEKQHLVYKDDALQSAIRIGKIMFNKTHTDYHPMQVLNTLYGGYFGSRLMSNIREDKGYTYGIGSGLVSLKHGGYFFITTEVGVDVCKNALTEIYSEMDRLREELVSDEELKLVKNYMLGTFLRNVDGPFALADRFKGLLEYNLGYDYFDKYMSTIKNISPSQIRELANTYFDKGSMVELVVGKK